MYTLILKDSPISIPTDQRIRLQYAYREINQNAYRILCGTII